MTPDYNTGHPSTASLPKDLEMKAPELMSDIPSGSTRPIINYEEAKFFKEFGYVIKRGLLTNKRQLEKSVDHLWSKAPSDILDRQNPDSWINSPGEKWNEQLHAEVGTLYGTNWKMRSRGPEGVGTEKFLVDEIANHPLMLSLAESFLGGRIKLVERVRGIYAVFPLPRGETGKLAPHGDYMAAQVSAMVLVTDAKPHCGGFTVWPGSHNLLHMQWDRVHGSTITGERIEGYRETRDRILREITPVEFTGERGDVIFWHPRLIHSAGVNQSIDLGEPVVRIIVPCDYQLAGQTYVDDLEFGPGPVYQWWVDTRNFAEDSVSTAENMWDSWAI